MDREEALRLMGSDVVSAIQAEAEDIGATITSDLEGVALYAAQRADHLSLAVGEPGFELALQAERDNVALKVTSDTVTRADAIDARILAAARGGLALAARAAAIMAVAQTGGGSA